MKSSGKCRFLHDYFIQYAEQLPNQLAIVQGKDEVTYEQLRARALDYSGQLQAFGLRVGDKVLLEFEPCPQVIALMTACSMLGVVFIPLGPELPQTRVEEIAQIAEARLHIQLESSDCRTFSASCDVGRAVVTAEEGGKLTLIDHLPSQAQDSTKESQEEQAKLMDTDLVYIIFTSGTTGTPKGIMMSHQAVISFFEGMQEDCGSRTGLRIGTISPIQFDFSLLDMGLAFGSGSTLIQIPRSLVHHPARFLRYLSNKRVSQMNGVPSIWKPLLQTMSEQSAGELALEAILFAGEHFPPKDLWRLKNLFPSLRRIINCFGQSESIACTFRDIYDLVNADTQQVPIGKGQSNAELLLLDEQSQIINRPNEIGEIYLRGPILFSGYWKDADLTARTLVSHPLRPHHGEKVFRTGDLAYKDAVGEFYYIGRKDLQVKILGNRVEMGEVEQRLAQYPKVLQAVVVAVQEQSSTVLWAAVVCEGSDNPTIQELRSFCANELPTYMLPYKICFFKQLPTTSNGKTDRKRITAMMQDALAVTQ